MDDYDSTNSPTARLQHLADRMTHRRQYMASILADYQSKESLTKEEMRQKLKVTEHGMARLALCLRPNSSDSVFRAQAEAIASYTSAKLEELVAVIRYVEALEGLSSGSAVQSTEGEQTGSSPGLSGYLAAARDRSVSDIEQDLTDADRSTAGRDDDDVA